MVKGREAGERVLNKSIKIKSSHIVPLILKLKEHLLTIFFFEFDEGMCKI
jgi:hypothetical protein